MSYIEDKFYRRDKHEYELENNQGFIKWFKMMDASGLKTHPEIKFSDMQGLINHLNNCYHIKYPDYILDEEKKDHWREKISQLGDLDPRFSVSQMLSYLPLSESYLVECRYAIKGAEIYGPFYDTLYLYDKKTHKKKCLIQFDPFTGIVITSTNESYENCELESVLNELKKEPQRTDYHELENLLNSNLYERVLRHRLLQLTALKILYTSTTPKLGYERARKFIDEMNYELGLELSTDEIDKLYNEYSEERKKYQKAFPQIEAKKQSVSPKGPKVLKMKKEERIWTD